MANLVCHPYSLQERYANDLNSQQNIFPILPWNGHLARIQFNKTRIQFNQNPHIAFLKWMEYRGVRLCRGNSGIASTT